MQQNPVGDPADGRTADDEDQDDAAAAARAAAAYPARPRAVGPRRPPRARRHRGRPT